MQTLHVVQCSFNFLPHSQQHIWTKLLQVHCEKDVHLKFEWISCDQRRGTSAYLKPAVWFFPLTMDQRNQQYDVRHQPDRWENCTILTVGMQRVYWWISNVDVCQARIVGFVFSFFFDNQADVATPSCHICLEHIHSIIPTNQGMLDGGCMQVRLNLIWGFHFGVSMHCIFSCWQRDTL